MFRCVCCFRPCVCIGVGWHSTIIGLYRDLLLDEDVKRISSCELEVDVVAADILNRRQVDGP